MPTAILNLTRLHAAAQCASNEVTRYYLNGVLLECTASHITYVATDGHVLFAYQHEREPEDDKLIGNFIIHSDIIKAAKLDAKTRKFPFATLKRDGNRFELATPYNGGLVFTPIDGTFPEWRRVVPSSAANQGEAGDWMIDPRILVKLWKAGDLIDSPHPTLVPNGGSPALVMFDNQDAFGVVMPRRCGPTGAGVKPPFWVHNSGPALTIAKAA